jgi:gliding motility-associated-like protein
MQKSIRTAISLMCLTALCGSTNGQIVTSNAYTPTQLVQNVLVGAGVQTFNITYTGYSNAIGYFSGGNSGTPGLGIDSGVVMTNGTILANDPNYGAGMGPQGPNGSSGAGVDNGQPGDAYLTSVAGANTFNACILEFDFIPQADSIKFNYVFGTDEYMEYVTGGFADVFAFVLSGVTVTLAPTNIALIPSTSTPVTALNVNANINQQYYVDNENPPGTTIQYDGFTTVLTAMYPVQCGETYHIKLACADALDGIVDGGVFLEAGSFTVGAVNLSTEISYGSNNDTTLYEGCGQACLILSRTGSTSQSDTVSIVIGGTAVNGVDFIPAIPPQVIFQPGQDSIVICITSTQDNVAEGLETLLLSTNVTGPCVQSISALTLYLSDAYNIVVDLGDDTALCNSAPITLYANTTGGIEPLTYNWSTGATTTSIVVQPTVTTTYSVVVSDNCGTQVGIDSVTVYLPNVQALSIVALPKETAVCSGESVVLVSNATGGSMPYTYLWTTIAGPDQVPNPTGTINMFTPTATGSFNVWVREGCGDTAEVIINVTVEECAVIPPNVFTPNEDGVNDALVFYGLDKYPGSRLIVYNRWGTPIYENADYKNDWIPRDVSDGTYYYILNVSDGSSISGFVTILK